MENESYMKVFKQYALYAANDSEADECIKLTTDKTPVRPVITPKYIPVMTEFDPKIGLPTKHVMVIFKYPYKEHTRWTVPYSDLYDCFITKYDKSTMPEIPITFNTFGSNIVLYVLELLHIYLTDHGLDPYAIMCNMADIDIDTGSYIRTCYVYSNGYAEIIYADEKSINGLYFDDDPGHEAELTYDEPDDH